MLNNCVHRATFLQCFVELEPEAAHFMFFHKSCAKHHMRILLKKQSLNSSITGNIVLSKILHSCDFLSFSLTSLASAEHEGAVLGSLLEKTYSFVSVGT